VEKNMNLQEHIKKVLREELNIAPYLNRRVSSKKLHYIFDKVVAEVIKDFKTRQHRNSLVQFKNLINSEIMEDLHPILQRHYKKDGDIYDADQPYLDISSLLYDYFENDVEKIYNTEIANQANINESENKKVNLVKQLIHQLFDEVQFIKQSTYNGKPLLEVYFETNSLAMNIESWFTHDICETIEEYTGGSVKIAPSWGSPLRSKITDADVLIDCIVIKYDNLGNVIN
jgi:hypothetical protein